MRRRLAAGLMLAALLTGTALSGCASADLPSDVDTKLTDDWAEVAEVKIQIPPVGVCLLHGDQLEQPIACDKPHMVEVVHVGTITGDAKPTAPQIAAAYAECDTAAAKYLGRPWWDGRLKIDVTLPRDVAWEGGARWFRCDLTAVGDAGSDGTRTMHDGSLKGAIPAGLLLGCANAADSEDAARFMTDVSCTKRHNAEWVGFFRAAAGTSYPVNERQWGVLHKQCRLLATKYVGVSASMQGRFGSIAVPRNATAWATGDRAVRCAIWFDDKAMTKSARGSKGKGVPNF